MARKRRNWEKKQEARGALYAEYNEHRDFCENIAMLRGYDRRKAELETEKPRIKICPNCGETLCGS